MDSAENEHRRLERYPLTYAQSVHAHQRISDVIRPPQVKNEAGGSVLNRLQTT
jgi:hypothetical protein